MTTKEMIDEFNAAAQNTTAKGGPGCTLPRDLCAMNLLHKICPGNGDIISCGGYDEIFFRPYLEELAEKVTSDDIQILVWCGVRIDTATDSLAMYV